MAERSEAANETSDRYLYNKRGNVEIHICENEMIVGLRDFGGKREKAAQTPLIEERHLVIRNRIARSIEIEKIREQITVRIA